MVKIGPTTQKPALICWQVGVDAAYNAKQKKEVWLKQAMMTAFAQWFKRKAPA